MTASVAGRRLRRLGFAQAAGMSGKAVGSCAGRIRGLGAREAARAATTTLGK
jgi:hypothetical protein